MLPPQTLKNPQIDPLNKQKNLYNQGWRQRTVFETPLSKDELELILKTLRKELENLLGKQLYPILLLHALIMHRPFKTRLTEKNELSKLRRTHAIRSPQNLLFM